MNIGIAIPVLNASRDWAQLSESLLANLQNLGIGPNQVLIIDSSSDDDTPALARQAGFRLHSIQRSDFNHGATRQLAWELMPDADILVYLTQDAALVDASTIRRLLQGLKDPTVAAVYGRQLPRVGATPIEAHARYFNYPKHSTVRELHTRSELGFKSIFFSNSFAAYRREATASVGGFPNNVIFGEDTVLVGRLHLAGWQTAYVADAAVRHSHAHGIFDELKRYFDIGVLHSRESWMLREFGGASSEGMRFLKSELTFLLTHSPWLIPSSIVRTGAKLIGYSLGRQEQHLSRMVKRALSLNASYWNREESKAPPASSLGAHDS